MKVVFIGAGNLATRLSYEMHRKGFEIVQLFSQSKESAEALANCLQCDYTTSLQEVRNDAELYIFAVKDSVLEEVLQAMPHNKGLWVHTAGSIPMDIFAPYVSRFGVFYPLQTFSKNRECDFSSIPFFIEAHTAQDCSLLKKAASELSTKVIDASSEQRKHLHLAAVFANNFANHMFAIASRLVEEQGLPFDALQPLIAETAEKIRILHPLQAQTGPAMRYDENVMNNHLSLLNDENLREIYRLLSKSIYDHSK
ncbi:MAG: DUF2520 domain-containing protein [Bacteroidales bacterium]